MFTVKNAVYVAIMQVWVIVMGVLAGGLWLKSFNEMHVAPSAYISLLENYKHLFLIIPLIWITGTLIIRQQNNVSDETKNLIFWFGVLIVIALGVFVVYANIEPLFHGTWSMSGGDEN